MAQKNPIGDALLTLYENQYATRQAQLDLERAQTRQKAYGREAVPGVFAELKAQEMKRQKQQQAIQKADQGSQQKQQMQALLPQPIDVTGQTGGRDIAGSLKSASEIAQGVIGGRTAQQQGPLGAQSQWQPINPQGTPAGAISQQSPGPQASTVGAPAPATAPTPGSTTMGPVGPPGAIVQTPVPGNRGVGALELILGIATRSGQMMLEGGRQLATGETLVQRQVPTLEQIGSAYAKDLAELEMLRQNATDPQVQAASENLYKQRLEEIRTRYGDDAVDYSTKEMTTVVLEKNRVKQEKLAAEERALTHSKELSGFRADLQAQNARDLANYNSGLRTAEQIAEENRKRMTLEGQLSARQAELNLKYLESGEKALSQPELAALPPETQRRIALKQMPKLSPTTKAQLEEMVNTARSYQGLARQAKDHWNPGYFSTGADAWAFTYKHRSRMAEGGLTMAALSAEEQQWLDDYQGMDTPVKNLKADVIRSKAGAAATPLELELYKPTIPGENDSKETAGKKLDLFIEYQGMTALRADLALNVGYGIEEAKTNWPFSDMRKMVSAFEDAAVVKLQEENPTMDPAVALRQVDEMIMNKYGLDASKYAQ